MKLSVKKDNKKKLLVLLWLFHIKRFGDKMKMLNLSSKFFLFYLTRFLWERERKKNWYIICLVIIICQIYNVFCLRARIINIRDWEQYDENQNKKHKMQTFVKKGQSEENYIYLNLNWTNNEYELPILVIGCVFVIFSQNTFFF